MTTPKPILIIGVGNDYRGDDGAGLQVARELDARDLPHVRIIEGIGDGTDMINAWQDAGKAFVIDAVYSDAEPGTVYRFDGLSDRIDEKIFAGYSTHAYSIPRTIELARTIDQLPSSLIIFGIEGGNYASGKGISPKIAVAIREVVGRIIEEIEATGHNES